MLAEKINPNLVKVGEKVVNRYWVITTRYLVFRAYEPTSPSIFSSQHSTVTHFDELSGRWGDVCTRRLSEKDNSLPVGDERSAAVKAHYQGLFRESVEAIFQAYPELSEVAPSDIHISDGEVIWYLSDAAQARKTVQPDWNPQE